MLQKKVDDLNKKIELLKSQQQQVETDIAQHLLHVIKTHSGFTLPFHSLIGGLIEVMQTCRDNPHKMEEWQSAGEKFLKLKSRSRPTPQSKQQSTSSTKSKKAE